MIEFIASKHQTTLLKFTTTNDTIYTLFGLLVSTFLRFFCGLDTKWIGDFSRIVYKTTMFELAVVFLYENNQNIIKHNDT